MSRKEDYEQRTEALLGPVLDANGFELVDVEYVKEGSNWYLRAFIDKPGGITIDDCELVSRALSDRLDQEDFIPDAYILEVSSPGLGRQLKKERDLKRSIGEEVEIKLYKAHKETVNNKTVSVKEYRGVLTGYDEGRIMIETEKGESITIERESVAAIRLAFDF